MSQEIPGGRFFGVYYLLIISGLIYLARHDEPRPWLQKAAILVTLLLMGWTVVGWMRALPGACRAVLRKEWWQREAWQYRWRITWEVLVLVLALCLFTLPFVMFRGAIDAGLRVIRRLFGVTGDMAYAILLLWMFLCAMAVMRWWRLIRLREREGR